VRSPISRIWGTVLWQRSVDTFAVRRTRAFPSPAQLPQTSRSRSRSQGPVQSITTVTRNSRATISTARHESSQRSPSHNVRKPPPHNHDIHALIAGSNVLFAAATAAAAAPTRAPALAPVGTTIQSGPSNTGPPTSPAGRLRYEGSQIQLWGESPFSIAALRAAWCHAHFHEPLSPVSNAAALSPRVHSSCSLFHGTGTCSTADSEEGLLRRLA
jgi:hypothetical protein